MSRSSRKRSARAGTNRLDTESPLERLHELLGHPLQLMSMYLRLAQKLGMKEHWLTAPDDKSQALLMLTMGEPSRNSRLILAGIHGDEPAGVIGLLSFLFTLLERPCFLRQAGTFALVPMMSPSAFELQTRFNLWDEDANRGFSIGGVKVPLSEQPRPSREGRILAKNMDRLSLWARRMVLAMHEDRDEKAFYLYAFNAGEKPSPMALRLRDAGAKLFGAVPDSDDFEGSQIRDGIILNHVVHGALDELLFKQLGVPVVVTETPGLRSLESRAEASLRLLDVFLLGR